MKAAQRLIQEGRLTGMIVVSPEDALIRATGKSPERATDAEYALALAYHQLDGLPRVEDLIIDTKARTLSFSVPDLDVDKDMGPHRVNIRIRLQNKGNGKVKITQVKSVSKRLRSMLYGMEMWPVKFPQLIRNILL